MITVFIISLASAILFGYREYNSWPYSRDYVLTFLVFILSGFIGMIFGVIVAAILPSDMTTEFKTEKLVSMNRDGSINGSFFLGSGSIESKQQYSYFVKDSIFFELKSVDVDVSKITYTNETPKVVMSRKVPTGFWGEWFTLSLHPKNYIFYIPEGSILHNYNLN